MSQSPCVSVDAFVRKTLRPDVVGTQAYHVANATGMLKLDAMENPYTLPAHLLHELGLRLSKASLNRYPQPHSRTLEAMLRLFTPIPDVVRVLFGNGSDELISILIQACCAPGDCVLAPEPTFVMYRGSAQWCHAKFIGVDLNADFSLNLPAMLEAIQTHQPKLIFLAYPNNPTGNSFDRLAMQAILKAAPGLVVIDEAYEPFGHDTWMHNVLTYPNLLVLRTLSKLGLAGIRLGYLAGSAEWIHHIDKVRPPYNINVLTDIAAEFVLEHADVIKHQTEILKQQRELLASQLSMLENVKVFASDANFLLIRCAEASKVFEALKIRGILVKNVSNAHPLLSDCLRITVSTPKENEILMAALHEVLAP